MFPVIFLTFLITVALLIAVAYPIFLRRRRTLELLSRVVDEISVGRTGERAGVRADVTAPGEFGRVGRKANELSDALERARKQGQLEREHLATLLTHADELVIATDAQDKVALINPAAAAGLGRTFAELAGKFIGDVFPQREIMDLYKVAASSPIAQPVATEVRVPTKSRLLQCHMTAVAMRTLEEYRGTLLLIRDMTEITQAVQMKTDFVANASHELRTPLASIRAAVETINEAGIDDAETTRRCVDIIGGHVLRLQMMVQDLLDLSRTEDPRAVVRNDRVDLANVCEMVMGMFASVTAEKRVRLETHLGDESRSVRGDERLILLILKNLVDNALKFTPAGGRVQITSDVRDADVKGASLGGIIPIGEPRKVPQKIKHWCVIEVADTGCGIPPEDQQRVFERFYTVNRSRGGADRGTGLGLAIVKHAMAAMGGAVQLESEVNRGTTIRCLLPVSAEEPDLPP